MQTAMQTLFPPLLTYAQSTGSVEPLNALITEWAKSQDFDASKFLLSPPPPPPEQMPPEQMQGPQGMPPEGAAA